VDLSQRLKISSFQINSSICHKMGEMEMFDAKESKKPVRIGICEEGISIFKDQLRTHQFVWQIMKQLEVQRKTFTIKLKKEYEEPKKLLFKLEDKATAKSCWEKAVEAHTSFLSAKPKDISHQSTAQETFGSSLSRSQINDDIPTDESNTSTVRVMSNSGREIVIDHVEVRSSPLLPDDSVVPPQSPPDLNEALSSVHTCYSSVTPTTSPKQKSAQKSSYGCNGKSRNIFDDGQEKKNQLVSSNIVEAGDRIIETTTYKTLKDGILQTKVEHQVKVTGSKADQKAAILKALEDATGLHANNEVKKTEVKVERSPSMF